MYIDEQTILCELGISVHDIECIDLRYNRAYSDISTQDYDDNDTIIDAFEDQIEQRQLLAEREEDMFWEYNGEVDDCIAEMEAEENAIRYREFLSEPPSKFAYNSETDMCAGAQY